eukprot:TRINITY_DN4361_c0_g2_i1.p1 TRINITY_DN4361_c0_g2~~TRINITY_DN4361_c0_g2_i1.p1  ORF type:complete len:106 (+),score=8.75 TRINITY_DN4361_c0_g2_i1:335-652(+)
MCSLQAPIRWMRQLKLVSSTLQYASKIKIKALIIVHTLSQVSYSMAGGDPVVGQLAKAQRWQMPQATMLGVQPFIGFKFGSSAVEQLSGKVCMRSPSTTGIVLKF